MTMVFNNVTAHAQKSIFVSWKLSTD